MSYELPNPTLLRTKPVYDISNLGQNFTFPLILAQSSNIVALTPSTATYHQTTELTALPIDTMSRVISNVDSIAMLGAGDDTNFDQTFLISPDMTFFSYKISITMGIGLKVSAFSSGTINVNNVHITITELGQGAGNVQMIDLIIDTGSPDLSGTGEQITLFHADIVQPLKFTKAMPVKIRIQTEASATGTATFQTGLLPLFCVTPNAVIKQFLESQIEIHAHASLDHAFPVFRDQTNQEKLDYSGCSSEGCK